MKSIPLFMLFALGHCCYGQTDTNLLAVGDWSAAVEDQQHWLRGRLLVYDDSVESAGNHARVYLELQHVFHGFSSTVEIYFDACFGTGMHFHLENDFGEVAPSASIFLRGVMPNPTCLTLPCDSTVRVRADLWHMQREAKPDGLQIIVNNGRGWIVPRNATNDFFLWAEFTPPGGHRSPLNYFVWQGTLKLPRVRIPFKKP